MGIRFLCPSCRHKLNVKPFLAGKRGVCPNCGAGLDIPLESQIGPLSGEHPAPLIPASVHPSDEPSARFLLSDEQRNAAESGMLVRVALPHPGTDVRDYVAWAARRLDAHHCDIRAARPDHVRCYASRRVDNSGSQVEDEVGIIVRDYDGLGGRLLYWVAVVIVDLCNCPTPRGECPVQWPKAWQG